MTIVGRTIIETGTTTDDVDWIKLDDGNKYYLNSSSRLEEEEICEPSTEELDKESMQDDMIESSYKKGSGTMKKDKDITLFDFLNSCGDFDGELLSMYLEESSFSFVWNDNIKLTEEGKSHFSKILNSKVVIKNLHIWLQDSKILQDEYDEFLRACAGYVSQTNYDKWFMENRQ